MRNDWNWIVAGLVAAILLPTLTLIGLPVLYAGGVALVAFGGLVALLSPRRLFEGLDVRAIGRDKIAFAQELLGEAIPAAERLRTAGRRIDAVGVKTRVTHLAEIAEDVFAKVEANPASASSVKRFLSYYLPRAAEVAEGYAVLEEKRLPDPAKLEEVGGVIGKLEDAFVHYADSLADHALGGLDIDIRLIQASLKEDIGR